MKLRTGMWVAFTLWSIATLLVMLGFTLQTIESRIASEEAWRRVKRDGVASGTPWRLDSMALPVYPSRPRLLGAILVQWSIVILALASLATLLAIATDMIGRRERFVAAVTHELRTPLTTIRLYADLLEDGGAAKSEDRDRYLRTLTAETRRLEHLIDNVLTHARLDGGHAPENMQAVRVADILDECRPRFEVRAEQHQAEIVMEGEVENRDICVWADPTGVERVLFNLVDNACKYIGDATDRRIHVGVEVEGGRVLVTVRDHGPGIDRGKAAGLFRAFHQAERESGNGGQGVGLGLAISKRLAERMGGRLRLDSKVTDGACFELSLPESG